jgi:hypothetical protein
VENQQSSTISYTGKTMDIVLEKIERGANGEIRFNGYVRENPNVLAGI